MDIIFPLFPSNFPINFPLSPTENYTSYNDWDCLAIWFTDQGSLFWEHNFLAKVSTLYSYFWCWFSTLTAHFEAEFSTPHPSFQPILGPCAEVRDENPMSEFSNCRAVITRDNPSNSVRCNANVNKPLRFCGVWSPQKCNSATAQSRTNASDIAHFVRIV